MKKVLLAAATALTHLGVTFDRKWTRDGRAVVLRSAESNGSKK